MPCYACTVSPSSNAVSVARSTKPSPQPLATLSTLEKPDRVIASKTVTGYFKTLLPGDYLYAKVRAETGEEILFRIEKNENCFLLEQAKAPLAIDYEVVERFIPQGGNYYPINIIRAIKTDRTDLATWQRSLTSSKLEHCRENTP